MEPIIFTIANEVAAIPAVQAAAATYVRSAGGGGEIARQTELVIEEVVTNILQYEYLPGQREAITLTLSLQGGLLEWLIRFRGIPFDVAYLRQWEQKADPIQMVENGGRGIGLRLLHRYSDEVLYRNRGRQGQEIRIRRFVAAAGGETALPEAEAAPPAFRIGVRRMRPDEAAAISKLAYFAYHYTYFKEELYDPEEVRRRNEDGRMQSYVAVREDTGEVVGHLAMIPDRLSAMPELGVAFIHPHYRRGGGLKALVEFVISEAQRQEWQGSFATAVTSHPYSQMSATQMGMRETALFVSRVPPLAFQAISDRALSRESFLSFVRLFDRLPRQPYYPPARHAAMLARIGEHLSLSLSFPEPPAGEALPEQGAMEAKTDAYGAGHLVLRRWGGDSLSRIQGTLRHWCLDRLETIYLFLPLSQPPTAALCPALEEKGFFFSGLMPGEGGADWLVMQYLNNQRYDYGLIKPATPFGQTLVDYVRSCDPIAEAAP